MEPIIAKYNKLYSKLIQLPVVSPDSIVQHLVLAAPVVLHRTVWIWNTQRKDKILIILQ